MKEVNLMEFVYETFFATNIMCKRDNVVKKVEVDLWSQIREQMSDPEIS